MCVLTKIDRIFLTTFLPVLRLTFALLVIPPLTILLHFKSVLFSTTTSLFLCVAG